MGEDEKEEPKKVEEGDIEEDKTTVEVAKAEANNIRATAEHNVKVMKRLGSMEASQGKILAGVEEMKKVVLKDEKKIESMEKKQEEESEKKENVDKERKNVDDEKEEDDVEGKEEDKEEEKEEKEEDKEEEKEEEREEEEDEEEEEKEDEKEEPKKVEEGDNEEDKTTVEVAKAEANNIRATAEHNVKVMKRLGSMEASQGKILAGA